MYIWEKRYDTAMLYRYPKSKKYPYEIPTKQGIPGQIKEKQNYDKSIIHLPRQCLRDRANALILLGFLDENIEFTSYLHLWKIGAE